MNYRLMLTKFSLLWELLPFFGSYEQWKLLMQWISKGTKQWWIKNQQAFQELFNGSRIRLICHRYQFDQKYLEYLSDPQALLDNKIWIQFSPIIPSERDIRKLIKFIKKAKDSGFNPVFYEIQLPFSEAAKDIVKSLYDVLKDLGEDSGKALFQKWRITALDSYNLF